MNINNKQHGQSATEYLVVLIVVMAIVGIEFSEKGSVITIFLDAVKEGFEKFSSFLSLP